MDTATCLAVALLLDAIFGEPVVLWSKVPHPAIVMGRAVNALDTALNQGKWRRPRGCIAVVILGCGAVALGLMLTALPLGQLWSGLLAAILLAQRSLTQHVADVARGLRDGLPEGRQMVARIVGRDTAQMDAPAVARSAIESAAENLSDGIVAPAFWFLIAGPPGILLYKVINTADSMIGYRSERYAQFGWAAARLDDVLNWVPARLTALIIVGLYGLGGARRAIITEARRHRSPNAGWPEAAAARAMDVALSGPRSYDGQVQDYPYVHPDGDRDIGPADVDRSVRLLWRVWAALFGATVLLALINL